MGLLGRRSPLLRLQGDERLIALVRDGQEHAFEALFERYQVRLFAFCRGMLASSEDAEDVLQEVFVAAHKAILADNRTINARPWLYRIARNRCLNHLRRPVPEGQDSMDEHPHEHGVSVAERVQTRAEFRALIDDVQNLPETQRTALLLREIDALAYEEIALAMDTTVPAVKSLLVRARMSLANCSQARLLTCDEVHLELAEAAEGLRKASGPVRAHLRGCDRCRDFRSQLRRNRRALAGLAPVGPLLGVYQALTAKLGTGTVGGGVGATAGGGGVAGGGVAAGAGAIGAKAAAGVASVALLTAGAVEVNRIYDGQRAAAPAPPPLQESATARATTATAMSGTNVAPHLAPAHHADRGEAPTGSDGQGESPLPAPDDPVEATEPIEPSEPGEDGALDDGAPAELPGEELTNDVPAPASDAVTGEADSGTGHADPPPQPPPAEQAPWEPAPRTPPAPPPAGVVVPPERAVSPDQPEA